MAAFVIADVDVKDPDKFKEYSKLTPNILKNYGGRYLVRGGNVEVVEGTWTPNRLVVMEFESIAQLKRWYNSPDYTDALKIRQGSSESNVIVAEGVES
tara:strand:- start:963 stop:1256 length:294 start_codon:yes stop_codon:yes gene_type:complete